jgi:hypothetical protein
MTKRLLTAIGVAILCGLAADAAWGAWVGVGVAVYVTVMGLVLIVLQRNAQDLEDLKDELEDRRNRLLRRRGGGTR